MVIGAEARGELQPSEYPQGGCGGGNGDSGVVVMVVVAAARGTVAK